MSSSRPTRRRRRPPPCSSGAKAADNAATFASGSSNISARPRTGASASWTPPSWTTVGEAGAGRADPDLSALIQEIVNRPGWVSGNALALVVTGSGHRTSQAFEGSAARAALLHVEFGAGMPLAPVNTAPPTIAGIAEAGADLERDLGELVWHAADRLRAPVASLRPGGGLACADVVPAGGASYALTSDDVGHTIRVAVTATNTVGSSMATSAPPPSSSRRGRRTRSSPPPATSAGRPPAVRRPLTRSGRLTWDRVLTLGDNAYERGTLSE